jgi:hypothetical protein
MDWAVAVTTAPRGPSWLMPTIESLARAGWKDLTLQAEPGTYIPCDIPQVQVVTNAHRLGPHLNFRAALAGLVRENAKADAHAVFEDDIEVTRSLRFWLETEGLWPSGRVGVVSLYTASVNHRDQEGWHLCDDLPRRACGALAYVFPPDAARDFASRPPVRNTWGQQDYWVGRWCREAGLQYWMHSPSFVRHLGEVSTTLGRGLDEQRQCRRFLEGITIAADGYASG